MATAFPSTPTRPGGGTPRGGHRQTSGVAGRGAGPSPLAVPRGAVPRRSLTSCSEQRKMSVQRPVQQPMVAAGEPPPPLLARPSRVGAAPEAKPGGGSPHPDGAAAAPSPPPSFFLSLLLCKGRRRAARPRGGAAGGGGLCPVAGKGQGPGVGVCGAGREGKEGRRGGRCGGAAGGRDGGDGERLRAGEGMRGAEGVGTGSLAAPGRDGAARSGSLVASARGKFKRLGRLRRSPARPHGRAPAGRARLRRRCPGPFPRPAVPGGVGGYFGDPLPASAPCLG